VRRHLHESIAVLLCVAGAGPVAVRDDDVPVGSNGAGGGADEGVCSRAGDARLPEAQQELAVLTELVDLKAATARGGVVPEWPAVARPQVAVVVHAEAMCLHDEALAESFGDL